jgi:hypothetical protein
MPVHMLLLAEPLKDLDDGDRRVEPTPRSNFVHPLTMFVTLGNVVRVNTCACYTLATQGVGR